MQKLVSQLVVHYQGNTFTFYGETAASVFQKYAQSYGLARKQQQLDLKLGTHTLVSKLTLQQRNEKNVGISKGQRGMFEWEVTAFSLVG